MPPKPAEQPRWPSCLRHRDQQQSSDCCTGPKAGKGKSGKAEVAQKEYREDSSDGDFERWVFPSSWDDKDGKGYASACANAKERRRRRRLCKVRGEPAAGKDGKGKEGQGKAKPGPSVKRPWEEDVQDEDKKCWFDPYTPPEWDSDDH